MEIKYLVLDDTITYEDMRQYERLLPEYRRGKIARYRFESDKIRSIVAGLLIRCAVGDKSLRFGKHEKPYVADNSLFFSVSHSGDIVAIAIDSVEVGMDVEKLPEPDRLKIADRFYHVNERAYVNDADDECRAFCRIWTRKEAYLKCTGEGISTDLTAFDTTSLPLSGRIITHDLEGYCLSACSEKPLNRDDVDISILELKELLTSC